MDIVGKPFDPEKSCFTFCCWATGHTAQVALHNAHHFLSQISRDYLVSCSLITPECLKKSDNHLNTSSEWMNQIKVVASYSFFVKIYTWLTSMYLIYVSLYGEASSAIFKVLLNKKRKLSFPSRPPLQSAKRHSRVFPVVRTYHQQIISYCEQQLQRPLDQTVWTFSRSFPVLIMQREAKWKTFLDFTGLESKLHVAQYDACFHFSDPT